MKSSCRVSITNSVIMDWMEGKHRGFIEKIFFRKKGGKDFQMCHVSSEYFSVFSLQWLNDDERTLVTSSSSSFVVVRWRTFLFQRGQLKMKMTLKVHHQVTRFRSSNLLHKPREWIIFCLFYTCDCDRELLKTEILSIGILIPSSCRFPLRPKDKVRNFQGILFSLSSAKLNGRFLFFEVEYVQQVRPRPKCLPFDCVWQMICGLIFFTNRPIGFSFISHSHPPPFLQQFMLLAILFFLHLIFPCLWLFVGFSFHGCWGQQVRNRHTQQHRLSLGVAVDCLVLRPVSLFFVIVSPPSCPTKCVVMTQVVKSFSKNRCAHVVATPFRRSAPWPILFRVFP